MLHLSTRCRTAFLGFVLVGLTTVPVARAQADDPPETPKLKTKTRPGELKKYADVITGKAKTSRGVFTVHRLDDKVYFEIPPAALGKLMLWSTEVAKAPSGVGWGGSALGNRV